MGKSKNREGLLQRMLNWTERAGNALPHPATLFALFALSVLLLSGLGHILGWEVIHPGTKEIVRPINLLSKSGIHRILLEMVDNFTGFAPLGIVLAAMLGIGIAEQSGLIHAVIRLLVLNSPRHLLTFVIVLAGILSNVAADVGYVLLIPLAGVIFLAVGRHPVAGMAAAFAGVSGGFSANLVLGTVDPLLAGLSQEAARILDPSYLVNPTANYYFLVASTFVIAFTGTFITDKIVEPRLGKYTGSVTEKEDSFDTLSKKEKKGLLMALVTLLFIISITLIGIIPENGFFRGTDGGFLSSPLIRGVVAMLFVTAGGTGLAYGFTTGAFKNDSDVINGMADSMKTLATYLVLVFFALIIAFIQKYDPRAGIGTIIATMVPYSMAFLFVWILLLVAWLLLGLPLGPGAGINYIIK